MPPPIWPYALIPVAVAAGGAAWTSLRPPSPRVVGGIQHFAAGVVFYAAAGEVLPETVRRGAVWPVLAGGSAGIAAMLLLRRLAENARGPAGLVAASAVDALIDGVVLALGFAAGERQGMLLAIALGVEFLFLGLSISGAFGRRAARSTVIAVTTGVSLAVPLGVLLGGPIGALPGAARTATLAFGLIALLYLVTEELLTEAHEKPESAWGAAMFFVGFLSLTIVGQLMRSGEVQAYRGEGGAVAPSSRARSSCWTGFVAWASKPASAARR